MDLSKIYESMDHSVDGSLKKCIKILGLVREDDKEYQEAQEKIKAFKKELGINDVAEPKTTKSSKPGMVEYNGGYPEWTDKHKCLVNKHLTPDM
jgi:hypothetical protein